MAHEMKPPRFTQDQDDGCGRLTEHRDRVLASDLVERTELPAEGNGSI